MREAMSVRRAMARRSGLAMLVPTRGQTKREVKSRLISLQQRRLNA